MRYEQKNQYFNTCKKMSKMADAHTSPPPVPFSPRSIASITDGVHSNDVHNSIMNNLKSYRSGNETRLSGSDIDGAIDDDTSYNNGFEKTGKIIKQIGGASGNGRATVQHQSTADRQQRLIMGMIMLISTLTL